MDISIQVKDQPTNLHEGLVAENHNGNNHQRLDGLDEHLQRLEILTRKNFHHHLECLTDEEPLQSVADGLALGNISSLQIISLLS